MTYVLHTFCIICVLFRKPLGAPAVRAAPQQARPERAGRISERVQHFRV